MYTSIHSPLETHTGEPVRITFLVTDAAGAPVTVTGAAATYKIARRNGEAALLTKTEAAGITLLNDSAVVEFNTGELLQEGQPLLGDFFTQLKITKNGDTLVAAEGVLQVKAVIA